MDVIITNSKNVQDRLRDFTGYESKVIYPPTDVRRFSPRGDRSEEIGDREAPYKKTSYLLPPTSYFLSYARLSPPKRVDLIVDAFLDIPEEHLILTYGKNDPLKESIIAKIRNSKNIQAVESPDDARLISLI
jgi:glycosyltransferase involved in cell wall biosynthesis